MYMDRTFFDSTAKLVECGWVFGLSIRKLRTDKAYSEDTEIVVVFLVGNHENNYSELFSFFFFVVA